MALGEQEFNHVDLPPSQNQSDRFQNTCPRDTHCVPERTHVKSDGQHVATALLCSRLNFASPAWNEYTGIEVAER